MLAMPPEDPVSSTAVQHSDGVSNTHIRPVDHHAEIPREPYVGFTTLERTSTAQLFAPGPHPCAAPPRRRHAQSFLYEPLEQPDNLLRLLDVRVVTGHCNFVRVLTIQA